MTLLALITRRIKGTANGLLIKPAAEVHCAERRGSIITLAKGAEVTATVLLAL